MRHTDQSIQRRRRAVTAAVGIATAQASMTYATVMLARASCAQLRAEKLDGPGRGYSFYPRKQKTRRPLRHHATMLRSDPDEFERWFTLMPAEFDELFAWVRAELAALPARRLPTIERLAMCLYHLRTARPSQHIARLWGVGKSTVRTDIADIMLILDASPALAAEVSWPEPDERDAEVIRVARRYPQLSGAFVAVDGTKRAADHCGRTFDGELHKIDYDSHKGHGRHVLVVCMLSTGKIVWLGCNQGNRNECNQYPEYELSRLSGYWTHTTLPVDASAGRTEERLVAQTAIADSAYRLPVNSSAGAPLFLIPRKDLVHLESVRAVVEQVIGRVGNSWKLVSDKAGPWHLVGNGGVKGCGSMRGMALSQMYFLVAARLTTMMQERRSAYTRDPETFEWTDPSNVKLATAIGPL